MDEMTLAIVGLEYPNRDKSDRRFEAALCVVGEPVHLVPEPRNRFDSRAVAVVSARGVQLGYLTAERCGYIGARIAREPFEAAFQQWVGRVAYLRIRFGGGAMAMPPPLTVTEAEPQQELMDGVDPEGSPWGA